MQIFVNRESFSTMVLRVSGFEIFKFNANLGTVQWVLSIFKLAIGVVEFSNGGYKIRKIFA